MQLKMPYDVFLTYSREDFTKAQLLVQALESHDCSVFWEHHEFFGDDEWDVIGALRTLAEPKCIIVIWSQAALNFESVRQAAEQGLQRGNLLQIRIEQIILPPPFDQLYCADFSKWHGKPSDSEFVYFWEAVATKLVQSEGNNSDKSIPKSNQTPLVTRKTKFLPDIDWVDIPAGAYLSGSGSRQTTQTLDRFFISRYPITHRQYQTFIDAGGYEDERWWQDLIKPQPTKASWPQPNRPRDNVNWYEAVAFCRWLSAQLGFTITLPTEQQWEKAARGTDGREYPWGTSFQNGDANVFLDSNPENLNQTCAVGLFPHRASPYQVMDMAGNVWEWCLNQFDRPEQIEQNTSNAPRVLRGGCWDLKASDARTFIRRSRHPDLRDYDVGFRVVCRSPK